MMKLKHTHRGFQYLEFSDGNGEVCSMQCSSAIDPDLDQSFINPGSSYLWLGVDDAKPQILASQASDFGVKTREKTGWVEYPVPDDVMMTTRMHITRSQAKELAMALLHWSETGELPDNKTTGEKT